MQTITLPADVINRVEKSLEKALIEIRSLKKKKSTKKTIRFWTEAEWEKAEQEADEDIKAGRVYRLDILKDLDKPLSELAR